MGIGCDIWQDRALHCGVILWTSFITQVKFKEAAYTQPPAASIAAGTHGNMTTDNINSFLSTSKICRLRESNIFQARRAKTAAVSSAVTYR